MTRSGELRSGKGARDENFPVASWLIKPQHRPVIHAFYNFVRVADDIADHPALDSTEKLVRLDRLEISLLGGGEEPEGLALHEMLRDAGLTARHAQELLSAFRQDATKKRYATWDELIDYCSRSAMPVGRFVLDVHGEPRSTWPLSDALCAALQIINHLQDCGRDFRALDRVYIPLNALAPRGVRVEALGSAQASPALKDCLNALAVRTGTLLDESEGLDKTVADTGLALEISVIQSAARRLVAILQTRDPLSERVHLSKMEMAMATAQGCTRTLFHRLRRAATFAHRYQTP